MQPSAFEPNRVIEVNADVAYMARLNTTPDSDSSVGSYVGCVSLAHRSPRILPDTGCCLTEEVMGQGLATEMAKTVLKVIVEEPWWSRK